MATILSGVAPILGAALFPAAVVYLISRTSGWQTLAERYPLSVEFPPPKTRFGYGVFRGWVGYNGGIIVSSDRTGLYLRAMPIVLSFCHDPIYIPWSEVVRVEREEGLLENGYRIVTAKAPEVRFALRPGTFATVRDDARAAGVEGA